MQRAQEKLNLWAHRCYCVDRLLSDGLGDSGKQLLDDLRKRTKRRATWDKTTATGLQELEKIAGLAMRKFLTLSVKSKSSRKKWQEIHMQACNLADKIRKQTKDIDAYKRDDSVADDVIWI